VPRLEDWKTGRLEAYRKTGRLGDWKTGRLGDWETGRLLEDYWKTGRPAVTLPSTEACYHQAVFHVDL
jgi:hypothetical protein